MLVFSLLFAMLPTSVMADQSEQLLSSETSQTAQVGEAIVENTLLQEDSLQSESDTGNQAEASKEATITQAFREPISLMANVGDVTTLENTVITPSDGALYPYTGEPVTPPVTVSLRGEYFNEGEDYSVEYGENTNVGKGTITITGYGNLAGTRVITFDIAKIYGPDPSGNVALDLSYLAAALAEAATIDESMYASADIAALKTAVSRGNAYNNYYSSKDPLPRTTGRDDFNKSINNQLVVNDATRAIYSAIDKLGERYSDKFDFYVSSEDAKLYDNNKVQVGGLERGSIVSARLNRLTSTVEARQMEIRYFKDENTESGLVEYTQYSAMPSTWYVLQNDLYLAKEDLQDYPVKGIGAPYEVKVVHNTAFSKELPFDWASDFEALNWGDILNVQTVNDQWVLESREVNGETSYHYISVDYLEPLDEDAVVIAPIEPEENPNIASKEATENPDYRDPGVPGDNEYSGSGTGGGVQVPGVVGMWPNNGSTHVPIDASFYLGFTNNIAFQENLQYVQLQKADGTVVHARVYVSPNREVRRYIFIEPHAPLEYGTNYKIVKFPGIRANNGQVDPDYGEAFFSTEFNPYVPYVGNEDAGQPSGNGITFASKAEAYNPIPVGGDTPGTGGGDTPGTPTTPGTTPTAPKPGGGTQKPATQTKADEADADADDAAEETEELEVAAKSDDKQEEDQAQTAVPISADDTQGDGKASGQRAPIVPGVLWGSIAAIAVVAAVAGRQWYVAAGRRKKEEEEVNF